MEKVTRRFVLFGLGATAVTSCTAMVPEVSELLSATAPLPKQPHRFNDKNSVAEFFLKGKAPSDARNLTVKQLIDKHGDELTQAEIGVRVRPVGFDIALGDGKDRISLGTTYSGDGHIYLVFPENNVIEAGNTSTAGRWTASVLGVLTAAAVDSLNLRAHRDGLPVACVRSIPCRDRDGEYQRIWVIKKCSLVEVTIDYANALIAAIEFNRNALDYGTFTQNGNTATDAIAKFAGLSLPPEILSGHVIVSKPKGGEIDIPGLEKRIEITPSTSRVDISNITLPWLMALVTRLEDILHANMTTPPRPAPSVREALTARLQ